MARLTSALVLLIAVAGGLYQLYVKPLLVKLGHWRVIEAIGNTQCKTVPELQACEKLVLHQPTGLLYLACSTPESRVAWTPCLSRLNASGASNNDYVSTYDPSSSRITRLKIKNFTGNRGLSLHGMDVVPSSSNPSELFVYLVNHRAPLAGQPAHLVGADSSIEVFKAIIGSDTLVHIKTVEDEVILTPNDVVGYPDGQSFYFTNDHGEKVGLLRELDILGRATTSVGYCHVETGCKYAIRHMRGNNGITRAQNDTLYVTDVINGAVSILERQRDDTLVIVDAIKTDRGLDNISIDSAGVLWAAGVVKVLTLMKHFANPSISAPSSALRISLNTGPSSFYGEKYKIEKVFEDDGNIASGSTSVVHDAERGRLFLHGLSAPHLTVCKA
ncbi:Serum paraoxonase/arylesterase 2 [Hypsizygus marmoreus]|uniref:Serum paraoxonase/arylesterase 2 n=1 Tax=Hypsizygus marmoreus TaxID=39966 RepID=A0A369J3R4_HYPMA|nr:Serum paraoxonase/arylesterase 2 [Hypsizygus marmoreus]